MLTYEQMKKVIADYIEFWNARRIQERLGLKTPVD